MRQSFIEIGDAKSSTVNNWTLCKIQGMFRISIFKVWSEIDPSEENLITECSAHGIIISKLKIKNQTSTWICTRENYQNLDVELKKSYFFSNVEEECYTLSS